MHIKIIGAGGFIGSHLTTTLESSGHHVYPVFKNLELNQINESKWLNNQATNSTEARIVINLAGSWRNVTKEEIIQANHSHPKTILMNELTLGGVLIWIQASSYYQLYKNIYGVDKDLYSAQKQMFSNFLYSQSLTNYSLTVFDIFLPYITGPKEPNARIFSRLASAEINNKSIDLSSGNSVMPILDVRDLSNFISSLVQKSNKNLKSNYEIIYPKVHDILPLKAHIKNSLEGIIHLCKFGILEDRINEFTSTLELKNFYKTDKNLRSLTISFKDSVDILKQTITSDSD
jgi:nucleoside-diphosphate-sugar epimerase